MALQIGTGITIGGGITIQNEGGGGGGGNLGSIVVGTATAPGMFTTTYYGFSTTTYGPPNDFGSTTSAAILSFLEMSSAINKATVVYLKPSTTMGSVVINSYGLLPNGAGHDYVFTVNGVSQTLSPSYDGGQGQYYYSLAGVEDAFGMSTKVGQTLAVNVTL